MFISLAELSSCHRHLRKFLFSEFLLLFAEIIICVCLFPPVGFKPNLSLQDVFNYYFSRNLKQVEDYDHFC